MSPLEAVSLGAVQGVTEFLPISSSGHLVIFQHLLGLQEPELSFDIMVHVGTLAAIVVVFLQEVAAMLRHGLPELWRHVASRQIRPGGPPSPERMVMWVILASIPTAVIGLTGRETFEGWFGSPRVVGTMLMVTGTVLFLTRYASGRQHQASGMQGWQALSIGIVQGIAVIPGISRSGSTISAALLLGVERQLAATFSFMISLPATLGAVVLSLADLATAEPGQWTACGLGALVAFGTGYISLRWLLGVVKRGNLYNFAYYCWAAGAVGLLLGAS